MDKLAFGLFKDQAAADAAIVELERRGLPKDVVGVDEYVGEMPDEDLRSPGTRSRSYAVIGGVVAAAFAGVIAGLLFGDMLGAGRLATGLFVALGAGVLGALVAGIAGAAIPRRELAKLRPEIAAGRVLVTVDTRTQHTGEDMLAVLRELGAARTGLL
jgi:hypothetical protein